MVEDRRDQVGSSGPDRFKVEVTSETALVRLCHHPRAEVVYSEPLSSPKHFSNLDDKYALRGGVVSS